MENRLELLKGRVKRCVCKYCGQPLEIRRLTAAAQKPGRQNWFVWVVIVLSLVWSEKFIILPVILWMS